MSHRIDIMVGDDVWGFPREAPQGERRCTVNPTLREEVRRRRRLDAGAEMDRLRSDAEATSITSAEVVRRLWEERARER